MGIGRVCGVESARYKWLRPEILLMGVHSSKENTLFSLECTEIFQNSSLQFLPIQGLRVLFRHPRSVELVDDFP